MIRRRLAVYALAFVLNTLLWALILYTLLGLYFLATE